MALCVAAAQADSWEHIRTSKDYYWGEGEGQTKQEAKAMALSNLINSISVEVKSDFSLIYTENDANGSVSHDEKVRSCVNTYSKQILKNVEEMDLNPRKGCGIGVYMRKSELDKIYAERKERLYQYINYANSYMEENMVGDALCAYYNAYLLLSSLQHPDEIRDEKGLKSVYLEKQIKDILRDIKVEFRERKGDEIELGFTFKGKPIQSLEYTYNDGLGNCDGRVTDGDGTLTLNAGHEPAKIDIAIRYKDETQLDALMQALISLATPIVLKDAGKQVKLGKDTSLPSGHESLLMAAVPEVKHKNVTMESEVAISGSQYASIIDKVALAIANRNYSDVIGLFTSDGFAQYKRLIQYGSARIMGAPEIRYYSAPGGRTVARGLRMAFTFNGKSKKTFPEDVTFTFNSDNKIENVAFGLGEQVEKSILDRKGDMWRDDVKESIVGFMENYKTAYSLEDLEYIRNIFADEAIIIVGNVKKPGNRRMMDFDGIGLSLAGKDIVTGNRYSKDEYLDRLKACFRRNEFINLNFTDHKVAFLEKTHNSLKKNYFAINIRQKYSSSTYSDEGYLFLIVDMTDPDNPTIQVRTWQEADEDIENLYGAGDFNLY